MFCALVESDISGIASVYGVMYGTFILVKGNDILLLNAQICLHIQCLQAYHIHYEYSILY